MVAGVVPAVSVSDKVAAERPQPPRIVSEANFVVQETECAP